jgi:ABC-type multidrug transport system permease subunit
MIFLSGVWFSLEGAAPWLKKVASAFPLTPVIEASRLIMTEGATLSQVQPQVATLLILGTVFLISGAALFRWK